MSVSTTGGHLSRQIKLAITNYIGCGYGLIRGMLSSEETARLVEESERLWRQYVKFGPCNLRLGIRTDPTGKPVLDRLDPVADISATFEALNRDPRFISIAESGLGEPVTVMKEKLIYKRPGTRGFGPHCDEAYNKKISGVPGSEVVTISVALDRATIDSGPTEFFPSLRTRRTAAARDEPRDIDENDLLGVDSCMPITEPGDVILFDGQIPHRSGWNRSDHSRRIYMISYVPARYPHARTEIYAGRLAEQEEIRRDLVAGALFFQ